MKRGGCDVIKGKYLTEEHVRIPYSNGNLLSIPKAPQSKKSYRVVHLVEDKLLLTLK